MSSEANTMSAENNVISSAAIGRIVSVTGSQAVVMLDKETDTPPRQTRGTRRDPENRHPELGIARTGLRAQYPGAFAKRGRA